MISCLHGAIMFSEYYWLIRVYYTVGVYLQHTNIVQLNFRK